MSTKNLLASVILNSEPAPLKSGMLEGYPLSLLLFNTLSGDLASTVRQQYKKEKKTKLSLFVSDDCLQTFQKNLQINR